MITVHHLNNSRSQRVLWLLEELGVPYEIKRYQRDATTMLPLVMKLVFGRLETAPMPFFVKPIARGIAAKVKGSFIEPNIKAQLDYMEAELAKTTWFAGDEFSAADIQMSFPVEAAATRGGLDSARPKLMAFLARIHAMPAYKRAIEKGGPFELMR